MSEFQKALIEKGFEHVATEYNLKYVRHSKYKNLILFNYDQVHSPKTSPIVRSARGHIMNESTGWTYVARPFDRFFNLGEANTPHDLEGLNDVNSIKVFTKEDGSLISMWFYDGQWNISTRNIPEASGPIGNTTFDKLFWSTWNDLNYKLPDIAVYNEYTFMFELCTPMNQVKCVQIRPRIVLLGVRNNLTGREDIALDTFDMMYEQCAHHLTFNTTQDLRDSFRFYTGTQLEGYVVAVKKDETTVRYKVKNPAYLVLAYHIAFRYNNKLVQDDTLLDIVRQGEVEEVIASMPHLRERLLHVQVIYARFLEALEVAWKRVADISDQKAFALAVNSLPYPSMASILFKKRKMTDQSLDDIIQGKNIDWILKEFDQETN